MAESLEEAYDAERFRRRGHEIVDLLADCLGQTLRGETAQVLPWTEPEAALAEARSWLDLSAPELFRQVWQRSIRLHHPRYLGHQVSPPLPVAALAGLMGDLLNNGMAVYEMGMAATAMERCVVTIAARQLGMDAEADGVLTSGGSLANLTALLAARGIKGGDVWEQGSRQPTCFLAADEAHYCIDRAIRIMGWGAAGLVRVPTDHAHRLNVDLLPDYLHRARDAGCEVLGVIANACCTPTGSFDDLTRIGKFCRDHDLWFHVDGAHGAAAAFSTKYRHLVQGIELADSVALDFHKMLMAPALASAVIFRRGQDGYRAFAQQAEYLWSEGQSLEWYNSAKRSFECTKTMMGFKVFSIIAEHGLELLDQNVTRLHDLAADFAERIETTPDMELALRPQSNIVCFRYRGGSDDPKELDRVNAEIRRRILHEGEFYIVQTRLRGRVWLRTTVANPFTTGEDFAALIATIRRHGRACCLDATSR